MSKVKKKPIDRQKTISELDVKFEKIIQFSGWIFLLALGGIMGGWFLLDNVLEIISLDLDAILFSLIIFTGTNSAVSFGVSTKIKNNRDKKKGYFHDWLIGEFLLCMIAIFTVAAYQW
ncbi:MAG: hypothetical protein ACXAEX_03655 [Promethearchaeota archaeon]|jgi:hypothetical protein